ncbi:hypothetical protein X953_13955 [Virgibacillus sp. SK37]|nr:hypothetical protein X953_13955 [Virgibacillus sp. SK37]
MIRSIDILRINLWWMEQFILQRKHPLICVSGGRFHTSGYKCDICSLPHSVFFAAGMTSAASSATLRPGSSPHAIPAGVAGQQDVGHAIVATGRGVFRLPSSIPINWYVL